jgi:hypothetical protein
MIGYRALCRYSETFLNFFGLLQSFLGILLSSVIICFKSSAIINYLLLSSDYNLLISSTILCYLYLSSLIYITMKYFDWKIKKEHHILKEFDKFLQEIARLSEVQKIIPWRIKRQQKGTSQLRLSFSYETNSWLKFLMKKWSTAQELFVIVDRQYRQSVKDKILSIFEEYKNG